MNPRLTSVLLNLGHSLDHLVLLIFAAAVASIATDLGVDRWEDLMPYGAPAFFFFGLCSLPAGKMGDLWGRRKMMLVYFAGIGLSSILVSQAQSPWQLCCLLAVMGGFASIYHPVGIPMLIQQSTAVGKTIGIMVSVMYMMDGSVKTMNSTWNGPPGQMVRSLGKCFYSGTRIRLLDGTVKTIKDVDLGDILEDGSVVESVMKIDNKREPVPLYSIKNEGVDGDTIYVTGSHLIFDRETNKFIKVQDYRKAQPTNHNPEWFSCLITSHHRIKIGNELFWDWEDHFVKIMQ